MEARRQTHYVAVFGTLWGLMEVTLGTALKGLRIPFTGLVMAACATVVILAGRRFARRRGSVVMMGGVAALIKVFSLGGFVIGPVWAIVFEGLLAEIVLTTFGLNRLSSMLTGVVLLGYTTVHPFVAQGVLYGSDIYTIYLEMLRKFAAVLHIADVDLVPVAGVYLACIAIAGSAAGLAGLRLGHDVDRNLRRKRLGERTPC